MVVAQRHRRRRRGAPSYYATFWLLTGFSLGVAVNNVFRFSVDAFSRNLWNDDWYTLPSNIFLQEEPTIVDPAALGVYRDAQQVIKANGWPFSQPRQVRILFVHIGKAGGASVNEALRILMQAPKFLKCRMSHYHSKRDLFMDRCRQKRKGANKVAKITHRTFSDWHLKRPESPMERKWLLKNTNLHLFTIRDPVSRVVSAFNYHRWQVLQRGSELSYLSFDPVTLQFFRCFNNSQEIAQTIDPRRHRGLSKLEGFATNNLASDCYNLGMGVVNASLALPALDHFEYNYRYYLESTKSTLHTGDLDQRFMKRETNGIDARDNGHVTIAVTRMENLWGDLARIESMLGGSPEWFLDLEKQKHRVSHGSEDFAVTSSVDDDGAAALCCVIFDELQAYQDLVVAAVNLYEAEKMETLQALHKRCAKTEQRAFSAFKDIASWRWKEWADSPACRGTFQSIEQTV